MYLVNLKDVTNSTAEAANISRVKGKLKDKRPIEASISLPPHPANLQGPELKP
jgi:hypothetical protein